MDELLVYLNGRFIPASLAGLSIWDRGLVQAATVAELTRTFRKRLYRLEDHLDRLFRALNILQVDIRLSQEQLAALSRELVAHNARLSSDEADLGLVHFITAGEHAMYVIGRPPRREPTVCVHTFELPFDQWSERMKKGVHLRSPSIRQVPPLCWDPSMKCRSRMHYYLAEKEIQRVDPAAMALLLDLSGRVTETSSGNFLMLKRGVLISPPTDYTLPGIGRATILELALELGIPFATRDIILEEALTAEEAFLSSSSYCLLPVTRIDGTVIGTGQPGPMHAQLLSSWSQRVGVDIKRQIMGERDTTELG
jgi:branched-subunit amino acid aminotransferase/4-amino-4-deoxychorismate lyase